MRNRRSWFLAGAYVCVAGALMLILSTLLWF